MDSHGATGCKRTAHGDDLGTYNEMLNTTCAMSLAGGISLLDFFCTVALALGGRICLHLCILYFMETHSRELMSAARARRSHHKQI
jgi:hypothetical protein